MQDALLRWWEANGRHELPWRHRREAWPVLVSEVMLQQTQAARVVDPFRRFLARFPDVRACADADVGDVVRAWAGLGYNRRAVALHRCARLVVEQHGARIPDDLDALMALPGVGPYTARAVLVFAFGRPLGLVDTNAGRFVARAVAGRAVDRSEAQLLADSVVPRERAWEWGQAVFDLGALVCTRRSPACDECPVEHACRWTAHGRPSPDPVLGSAGTSAAQSAFAGSDRQGRGRLVAALRSAPVPGDEVALACGWADDQPRAARVVVQLVRDGLAVVDPDGTLRLPE